MQLKENKTIKQILTTFKGARIMVENYKTGLKFTHVVDVDKHIAAKIKQIPRLKTLSLQNKDKSFSMRMYQDPNNKLFPVLQL